MSFTAFTVACLLSARPAAPLEARAPHGLRPTLDALAEHPGFSLQEVGERAVRTSLERRGQQARIAELEARVDRARLGLLPRVTGSGRTAKLSAIPDQVFGTAVVAPGAEEGPLPPQTLLVAALVSVRIPRQQTWVQAEVTVPLSDILFRGLPLLRSVTDAKTAEALELDVISRRVSHAAQVQALEVLRAILALEVATRSVTLSESQAKDTATAESLGKANRADVLRARTQLAQAERQLFVARRRKALMDERLRTALHLEPAEALAVKMDLRAPLDGKPEVKMEEGVQRAWEQRPELRAAAARVSAVGGQRAAAWGAAVPRVQAFFEATDGKPNPRFLVPTRDYQTTWSLGLALVFSPNDALDAWTQVREKDAGQAALAAEKAVLEESIRLEVAEALRRVEETDAAIGSARQELQTAEAALDVRTQLFNVGKATASELLEARLLFTSAQLSLVNATIDQRQARLDLALTEGDPF